MLDHQRFDRFGLPSAEAALGGDPERRNVRERRGDAPVGAFDPVAVYQPEVEFGRSWQVERLCRREVRFIVAVFWHRHVNPVERSLQPGRDLVRDIHQFGNVFRLDEVAVCRVASNWPNSLVPGWGRAS